MLSSHAQIQKVLGEGKQELTEKVKSDQTQGNENLAMLDQLKIGLIELGYALVFPPDFGDVFKDEEKSNKEANIKNTYKNLENLLDILFKGLLDNSYNEKKPFDPERYFKNEDYKSKNKRKKISIAIYDIKTQEPIGFLILKFKPNHIKLDTAKKLSADIKALLAAEESLDDAKKLLVEQKKLEIEKLLTIENLTCYSIINRMGVSENYQRKGFGSVLLLTAMLLANNEYKLFMKKKYDLGAIYLKHGDKKSKKFYQSYGFDSFNRRSDGFDKLPYHESLARYDTDLKQNLPIDLGFIQGKIDKILENLKNAPNVKSQPDSTREEILSEKKVGLR